jgi:cell division septum initiation protein DivIVA
MTFEELWDHQQYTDEPDDKEFAKHFYFQGNADLMRENAQLKAVVAEQKEVIESRNKTIVMQQSERNKHFAKSADQSSLIETLAEALKVATSICWSNFSEAQEVVLCEALQQYELWKGQK